MRTRTRNKGSTLELVLSSTSADARGDMTGLTQGDLAPAGVKDWKAVKIWDHDEVGALWQEYSCKDGPEARFAQCSVVLDSKHGDAHVIAALFPGTY